MNYYSYFIYNFILTCSSNIIIKTHILHTIFSIDTKLNIYICLTIIFIYLSIQKMLFLITI